MTQIKKLQHFLINLYNNFPKDCLEKFKILTCYPNLILILDLILLLILEMINVKMKRNILAYNQR